MYCTYIRIMAMVSIILCHIASQHPSQYVQISAQFFNIGVQMFFCLSGFLFGTQGQIKSIGEWYKRRIKRIYIPWLLFVAFLTIIHLVKGNDVITWKWAKLVLGLQGTIVGVQGAGHTWFITSMLVCYAVTPILSVLCGVLDRKWVVAFLLFLPFVLALLPIRFFTLLCPICWYGIAYVVGQTFDEHWLNARNGMIALVIAMVTLSIRFAIRLVIDDPFWYDKLCVNYTQVVAACGLMFFVASLFKDSHAGSLGKYISDISFELYLYHYMLCAGPISIFAAQLPWIYSSLTIVACSFGMASIAHYISLNFIKIRRRNRQVRA